LVFILVLFQNEYNLMTSDFHIAICIALYDALTIYLRYLLVLLAVQIWPNKLVSIYCNEGLYILTDCRLCSEVQTKKLIMINDRLGSVAPIDLHHLNDSFLQHYKIT